LLFIFVGYPQQIVDGVIIVYSHHFSKILFRHTTLENYDLQRSPTSPNNVHEKQYQLDKGENIFNKTSNHLFWYAHPQKQETTNPHPS
jgi:hypothetical protein